ncbi:MAG: Dyp-type peroxidase [Solirubrobacteraceae bacterium]
MAAQALDVAAVQGLVVRGYGRLPAARYLLGEIEDVAATREWLARLPVATGGPHAGDSAVNVAFTAPGLRRLAGDVAEEFSREFVEGMTTEHRRRLLRDDPADWRWGNEPVDVLLLAYGADEEALAAHGLGPGVRLVRELDTIPLEPHEHFGFRDGISQPRLAELGGAPARDGVAAGEFVLGHRNEYGRLTPHPPLGRDGSYLVLRQLEQDVDGFWEWCRAAAPDAPERLAEKLVGRRRDGTPLVPAADLNDFAYFHADPHGLHCPIGAHVRRANPRDTLDPEPGTERSVAVNRRHRLLRRGRQYGTAPGERGLHFICLVANISRQFEFVQHSWLNDPQFNGLYDHPDPLLGPGGGTFAIQAEPVRERYTGLPRFVTVRGGAYFFLPGVRALRSLAAPA